MIVAEDISEAEFLTLVPSIKNNMDEWQIVVVKNIRASGLPQEDILDKLMQAFEDKEGIMYAPSEHKIICLVRLGKITKYSSLKTDLESKIPDQTCRILARKMSPAGLKQLQIDFLEKKNAGQYRNLYKEREERSQNVLLIVEDDLFIRKTFRKVLEYFGEIVEVERGDEALEAYKKHNPDAVILDIHLPGKDGLQLLDEIMDVDMDAYVIISSSDSVSETVLEAVERGAVGFLSKPPQKDKVIKYLNTCLTIT